mgnify:CR=1 FL=1
MKFTIKWLREYLDFDSTIKELSECLTGLGLEVESIIDPYVYLNDFKVCLIKKVYKHPNADKLKICEVFDGLQIINVVCGAKNARENLVTVLAPVGVTLPTINKVEGIKIKKGLIRDIESNGMLCSAEELGLEKSSEGIIELNETNEIGKSFSLYPNEELIVIEIAITPNRPDCAGVLGIARDLEAAGFGKLKYKYIIKVKENFKSNITVTNELESSACPELSFRLIKGVKNISSSESLKSKFSATGIKIISSLVDITNYLTFDRCRPLHVFDSDKVKGNITLRYSKDGEEFVGLDGIKYKLENDMVVICDDEGIISLAGIMGGERTSCDFSTKNVLLESAYFLPEKIAFAGRKLSIQSDARYRFERGIDPTSIHWGVQAATKMILDLCGGEASKPVQTKILENKQHTFDFNINKIKSLGGVDVPKDRQKSILESLGFSVSEKDNIFSITSPSFRPDIEGEADIVEEILRIHGFNEIPLTNVSDYIDKKTVLSSELKSFYKIKRAIANTGYVEAVTWSFMDEKVAKLISDNVIKIKNPISADLNVMRPSNIPNLLNAINLNKSKMIFSGKIFEVGPIFDETLEDRQVNVATGIAYGNISGNNWNSDKKDFDVFAIKSDLMRVLKSLNTPVDNLNYEAISNKVFHPGKSSSLRIGKNIIANFGELNPILLKSLDISNAVVAFEIFTETLAQFQSKKTSTVSAFDNNPFQAVERDFAFLLPKSVKAIDLINKIKKIDKKIINKVSIFDVYEGEKIDEKSKSIAIRVLLQPLEKTFSDEEIENISNQIIDVIITSFKASLRK